jgi:CrcB protein
VLRAWRPRPDVLGVIFVGGCTGGVARYAITSAWPDPGNRFPWGTFTVNVTGAFALAVIIVLAAELAPSRYLRPLLGTGFCGAFTTFSSVVVSTAELLAHQRVGTALFYIGATISAGLAAALAGRVLAGLVTHRPGRSEGRSG